MSNTSNVGRCGHAKCAGGKLCYEKGEPMRSYEEIRYEFARALTPNIMHAMNALTIQITRTSEGDYQYQVWPCDISMAHHAQERDDSTGDDNGGLCTGNMGDAVSMAAHAALKVVRTHFRCNIGNPDVCPSSLDENGEPLNEYDEDGEREEPKPTAHKWDMGLDARGDYVQKCTECGAHKS